MARMPNMRSEAEKAKRARRAADKRAGKGGNGGCVAALIGYRHDGVPLLPSAGLYHPAKNPFGLNDKSVRVVGIPSGMFLPKPELEDGEQSADELIKYDGFASIVGYPDPFGLKLLKRLDETETVVESGLVIEKVNEDVLPRPDVQSQFARRDRGEPAPLTIISDTGESGGADALPQVVVIDAPPLPVDAVDPVAIGQHASGLELSAEDRAAVAQIEAFRAANPAPKADPGVIVFKPKNVAKPLGVMPALGR